MLLCECGRLSNPKSHCVALWLLTFVKLYHPLNFQQVITLQGEDLLEEAAGTGAFRHQVHAEQGVPALNRTDPDRGSGKCNGGYFILPVVAVDF